MWPLLIVFSKFWSTNPSATLFGSKKNEKKDKFSFQRYVNHNVALTGFQFDLWNNPEFLTEAKKNHRHSSKNINYILLGCGVEILFLLSAQRSGVAWLATQLAALSTLSRWPSWDSLHVVGPLPAAFHPPPHHILLTLVWLWLRDTGSWEHWL